MKDKRHWLFQAKKNKPGPARIHYTRRQWKFLMGRGGVESSLDAQFGSAKTPKLRFTEMTFFRLSR